MNFLPKTREMGVLRSAGVFSEVEVSWHEDTALPLWDDLVAREEEGLLPKNRGMRFPRSAGML